MLLRACSNYSASVSSKDVFVSFPSRGRKSPCYTVLPPVFDILRKHSIPTLLISLVQQIRLPTLYDRRAHRYLPVSWMNFERLLQHKTGTPCFVDLLFSHLCAEYKDKWAGRQWNIPCAWPSSTKVLGVVHESLTCSLIHSLVIKIVLMYLTYIV